MKNINNIKTLSFSKETNICELKKKIHQKNENLSRNTIYIFKTSLFTEKSKNIIERINSSKKNSIKYLEFKGICCPLKSFQSRYFSLKQSKEKIINRKKDNTINNINSNDDNNNILKEKQNSININNDDIIYQIKNNNMIDNKTIYKNENKRKNNIKIINNTNKFKLFPSLSKVTNNNFISQNQSIINAYLANIKSKQKQFSKQNEIKLCNCNSIKFKLKSNNNTKKKKENNKKNIIKTLKKFKSIVKNYKIRSIHNCDDNLIISRNSSGNILIKKNNNRIHNKHVLSENKKI